MTKKTQEAIDDMEAAVREMTDAADAAEAMITRAADQIDEAADDPEEIHALANQLRARAKKLGQAVVENSDFQPSGVGPE